MTDLRYSPYSDSMSRSIAISASVHLAILFIFIVRTAWLPDEQIIVRNAVKVDLVALPEKPADVSTPTPAPAPVVAPVKPVETKVEPKPAPIPDAKATKDSQRKALEKLKAMEAIEKMQKEVNKPKPSPPKVAGNQISEGNSPTGLEKIEFDRYVGELDSQIKQHWKLPGWLAQSELRAQAKVLIDAEGRVIKKQLTVSSGNDVFDAEVFDAIDQSNFPPPPERLRDMLSLNGVTFTFPR